MMKKGIFFPGLERISPHFDFTGQPKMRKQMMQIHTNTFEKTSSHRLSVLRQTGVPDSHFSNNTILGKT